MSKFVGDSLICSKKHFFIFPSLTHSYIGVNFHHYRNDTLKSIKSQELTIPPSLSLPMPQDYVNYVMLSWLDTAGVEHPIFPARITSRPSESISPKEVPEYNGSRKFKLFNDS